MDELDETPNELLVSRSEGDAEQLLVYARDAVLRGVRLDDVPAERTVLGRVVQHGDFRLTVAFQVAEQLIGREERCRPLAVWQRVGRSDPLLEGGHEGHVRFFRGSPVCVRFHGQAV